MKTWIILFRGINVGGKNRLSMKELVSLLEEAGGQNVRTYIQSGNVVADFPGKPGKRIGDTIEAECGFNPDMVVMEQREFRELVAGNSLSSENGKAVHFYFSNNKLKPAMTKIRNALSHTEQFEINGKAFYLFAPDGIGRSKLVNNIDAFLGARVTGRNLNTITRIFQLLEKP